MGAALALVTAALALASLPPLPARGLARETRAGVQLQTLAGRPLATLPGLDLAPDQAIAAGKPRLILRTPRRAVPDVGRLALFVRAGVDRAVEVVVGQLAGDVGA
jgi:hypothetical protein